MNLFLRLLPVWLFLVIISCQDEVANKAVFTTQEVTRTSEGASFRANIAILDDTPYEDYGFVWSVGSNPTLKDSVYYFGHAPVEGEFTVEVKNDLVPGEIYNVRGFLKSRGTVIYSNMVRFESLGSATPIITSFNPRHASSGDTILVAGSNFSRVISNVKVAIGTAECEVLEASRERLKVRLPQSYNAGNFPVTVNVSGKSGQSKDNFTLDGPIIQSISPTSGAAGTIVTISGSNFSSTLSENHVRVGELAAVVTIASATQLVIQIPEDAMVGEKDIAIELNQATGMLPKAFTLTGPNIRSISPASGIQGATVTIEGSGFSAKAEENIVHMGTGGTAEIISASTEKLVVKVPQSMDAGTFSCYVTVRQASSMSNDQFTILGPEITMIEPTEQYGGRTIKVVGNYFKTESYPTHVYFAGSGYESNIINLSDTEMEIMVPYDLTIDAPLIIYVGGLKYTTSFDFHVLSPWKKQAEFPGEARYGAVGFAIGQYGYVGMGITNHGDMRDMWQYNSSNGTWKRMADFPGPSRAYAISFVVDGKAYVGLGGHYGNSSYDLIQPLTDLWEYNPTTDSWIQKNGMPHYFLLPYDLRVDAASVGRKGYFNVEHNLYEYDVDSDVWTRSSSPVLYQQVTVAFAGKLYVGLGPYYSLLYEYDPDARTWNDTQLGFQGSYGTVSFVLGDKLYTPAAADIKEIDLVQRTGRPAPWFRDLYGDPAIFTIGNVAYLVTGFDYQGSQHVVTFDSNY